MTSHSVRQVVLALLCLGLGFLGLGIGFSGIHSTHYALVTSSTQEWRQVLETSADRADSFEADLRPIVEGLVLANTTLTVDLTKSARAQYKTQITDRERSAALEGLLAKRAPLTSAESFVIGQRLFGNVSIDDRILTPRLPAFSISPEGAVELSMNVESEDAVLGAARLHVRVMSRFDDRAPTIDVVVRVPHDRTLMVETGTATARNVGEARFTLNPTEILDLILIDAARADDDGADRRELALDAWLGDLDRVTATGFVVALVTCLPLLLFLWLSRHDAYRLDPDVRNAFAAAAVLVMLFVTLGAVASMIGIAWDIQQGSAGTRYALLTQSLLSGFIDAQICVAVVFWPIAYLLLTRRLSSDSSMTFTPRQSPTSLIVGGAYLVALFAYVAVPLAALRLNPSAEGDVVAVLPPAALALGLLAIALIAFVITSGWHWILPAMFMAVGAAVAVSLDTVAFDTPIRIPILIAFTALATIPLLRAAWRLVPPTLRARAHATTRGILMVVAAAIMLVLAIPDPPNLTSGSVISSALSFWGPFMVLALLAALLALLRDDGTNPVVDIPPHVRDAGIVLALMFFPSPTHRWLHWPVVLALGYLLLRHWALRAPALLPTSAPASGIERIVRDLSRLHEYRRALRDLRKDLFSRLAKGTVTAADVDRQVDEMEVLVKDRERAVETADVAGVLALGPIALSPWQRATTGAWWGFWLGLPWIAVFAYSARQQPAPSSLEGWATFLLPFALGVARWPLQGLFLGYFFPAIRGRNGLDKGLTLFVTIAVPSAIAALLAAPTTADAGVALWLWVLQVFIHSILVGLIVGDYQLLKSAGLGWYHLGQLHNVGVLAAWGSSLVVAAGAAVTTLVTAGATSLLTMGLRTIFPRIEIPTP